MGQKEKTPNPEFNRPERSPGQDGPTQRLLNFHSPFLFGQASTSRGLRWSMTRVA
jgi:hypothetical protein